MTDPACRPSEGVSRHYPATSRSFVLLLALFVACVFFQGAQAQERVDLVVGYSAISASQTAPWIAQETGLFEKYRLNTRLVYIPSTKMAPAIVFGDVQIAQNNGVQVVDAVLGGADSVFIGGTSNTFHFYLMAYIEGLHLLFTNKKLAVDVIKKYTRTTDPQMLDLTYDYALKTVERVPRLRLDGIQTVLDVVAEVNPRAKNYKPSDFVNLSLLQDLEKDGFLKKFSRS